MSEAAKSEGVWHAAWRRFKADRVGLVSLVIVVGFVLLSLASGLGFAGMGFILGVTDGLPVPRNAGDWVALSSSMLWTAGTLRSFAKPSIPAVSASCS